MVTTTECGRVLQTIPFVVMVNYLPTLASTLQFYSCITKCLFLFQALLWIFLLVQKSSLMYPALASCCISVSIRCINHIQYQEHIVLEEWLLQNTISRNRMFPKNHLLTKMSLICLLKLAPRYEYSGRWDTTMENELVRGFPPSAFRLWHSHLKKKQIICHIALLCAIAQVHMSKHVSSLQTVLLEGYFVSWWEWELSDIKDRSVLRNNDYFLWSSCSLLKLSIILDNTMLHMVHKFSPPANIFISCVCMPKILDFLHTIKSKCFWIWTDLSLSHSILQSFKFNRIAVSVFRMMFSNVLAS